MSHRILIVGSTDSETKAQVLPAGCTLKYTAPLEEDDFIQIINGWRADGIYTQKQPISPKLLEQCPTVKAIQTDVIMPSDVRMAAARHGIQILSSPDERVICAAEQTLALLLALSRNLNTVYRQAIEGGMPYPYPAQWRTQREVETKQLLLLGLGPIGRRIVKKAQGFSLEISVYAPDVPVQELERIGAKKVEALIPALGGADYISLHPSDQPLILPRIGTEQFAAMKRDAFFLCTDPAVQVEQDALVQVLQGQRLAGAGIMLPEEAITPDSPLLHMDNVIAVPYDTGPEPDCDLNMQKRSVAVLMEALQGKPVDSLVNERELEQMGLLPMGTSLKGGIS